MVYISKKRKSRKTKSKSKNKNIKENYISPELKKCNKTLIKHENNCQCVNKKGYPSAKIDTCIKTKNNKKCSKYNECKKKFQQFMTVSNSEPEYNPDPWNKSYVKSSHNCYTYFLDDKIDSLKTKCSKECEKKQKRERKKGKQFECPPKNDNRISNCGDLKPQPGDYAYNQGDLSKNNDIYTCKSMENKVFQDNLNNNKSVITKVKFTDRCPKGRYKGAIVVDPGKNPKKGNTFHFYRQDKNMRFSHKPGVLEVENYDASGDPIYSPELADRNYNKRKSKNGINYKTFCGYYCIPNNRTADTNAI